MLRPTARTAALLAATVLALVLGVPATASAVPAETGQMRFINEADSSFDRFTGSPAESTKSFMRDHYYRQKSYAPYFDSRTSWFKNAWAYKDLYAIYKEDAEVASHPEWILKDGGGTKLFIPWGCGGGTCPQYAADIGNPGYRSFWIAQAREALSNGYRGLFIDDVNLEFRVGNGNGDQVPPTDPRTGRPMTHSAWRRYVADFVSQIRAAFPAVEIAHNPIWYAGHDDPDTARSLLAADWVDLERGVSDDGLTRGGGRFGFETFLEHIDWLHAHGKAVMFDAYTTTQQGAEYNMATLFLVNGTRDGLRTDYRKTPADWWTGYDVDLGPAQSARYEWKGLLRRDFARGYVLVNQPDSPRRTVSTPGATGPDGAPRSSVTLSGAQGAVVVGDKPAGRGGFSIRLKPFANPRSHVAFGARSGSARRLRRAVMIRGRIRGRDVRRGRLLLALKRRRGGRWVTVRRAAVRPARSGRFGKLVTGLRPGSYRVRARYARGGVRRAAVSPQRRFKIRR